MQNEDQTCCNRWRVTCQVFRVSRVAAIIVPGPLSPRGALSAGADGNQFPSGSCRSSGRRACGRGAGIRSLGLGEEAGQARRGEGGWSKESLAAGVSPGWVRNMLALVVVVKVTAKTKLFLTPRVSALEWAHNHVDGRPAFILLFV